jgi:hypothetical protein
MQIALTFSGGGFRAAAFSLGTISLMNRIKFGDGTLLDHVTVLSTVSGGTITGTRFAVGRKRNESFATIYDSLYSFLDNSRLVTEALERLASDEGWDNKRGRNLIIAFSDIYDRELFDGAKFGLLMNDPVGTGLRHTSFNATEFASALQFRFQWSERIMNPGPNEPERGIIGNNNFRVPPEFAEHIRMADIMASSSCFPGGFEPINFPDDFIMAPAELPVIGQTGTYPVGLMDGGIVDNQGIEPVLLAETRMKRNRNVQPEQTASNVIDLIIVCEVASPDMDAYMAVQQKDNAWWKDITPKAIAITNGLLLLLSILGGIFSFIYDHKILLVGCTVFFTITVLLVFLFRFVKSVSKRSGVPEEFFKPLGELLRLKLFIYENLIVNRFKSVLMLTMGVFLKHVRRLNYNVLYRDPAWKNRRIMNAIYELKSGDVSLQTKLASGKLPPYLKPSVLLEKNSDLAASMGTTLWFTKDELANLKMLEAIVACGQYNACWNLLEYIFQLKQNNDNTNVEHQKLIDCENQLLLLWNQFLVDPKGMVLGRF